MKKCRACFGEIEDAATHCKHCGQPQSEEKAPPDFTPPPPPQVPAKQRKPMSTGAKIAIGCAIVGGLGIPILGIVAAIAIPKFAVMLEKSREGATKGNLSAIKSAVSIYYGDHGRWPKAIDKEPFIGEYMEFLPSVKVTGNNSKNENYGQVEFPDSKRVVGKRDNKGGWYYNRQIGQVRVNLDTLDSKGIPYWEYGDE